MSAVDDGQPPPAGHKPAGGAMGDAKAFFVKHKTEVLAAGAVGVAGLALLHRRNAASTASDASSPVPAGPDTTGNDVPATYGYPTDGSPTSPGGGGVSITLNTTPSPAPPSPAGKKPKPKPKAPVKKPPAKKPVKPKKPPKKPKPVKPKKPVSGRRRAVFSRSRQ